MCEYVIDGMMRHAARLTAPSAAAGKALAAAARL
jgi:hypothetical protein